MAEQVTCRCGRCGTEFEYEEKVVAWHCQGQVRTRRVVRRVCTDCREGRKRWATKRTRKPRKLGLDPKVTASLPSRVEVGRQLGMTPSQVEEVERRALMKLRSSPELSEAYANFKESGMPMLQELMRQLRQPLPDRLLEWQLELMEWWRVQEAAQSVGLRPEAQEALSAIARCHAGLRKQIEKLIR